MPRRKRINYENAIHHVMLRGNYKYNIFFEEDNYKQFYRLLARVVKNYGCRIHLFCLMTNHVHLMIETTYSSLGKIIHSITSPYVRIINKDIELNGHLFQGRYKSKVVQDIAYATCLCYYIHNNPVAAGLVSDLDDYPWSSHHTYTGSDPLPWVSTTYILQLLRNQKIDYGDFICPERADSYDDMHEFDFDLSNQPNAVPSHIIELNLNHLSIKKISEVVCDCMELSLDRVISKSREQSCVIARAMITYFAHYHGSHQLNRIAVFQNRQPYSLTKTLHSILTSKNYEVLAKRWLHLIHEEFTDRLHRKS